MIRFSKIYIISLIICSILVGVLAYIPSQEKYERPENAAELLGINLPTYEIRKIKYYKYDLCFVSPISEKELDKVKHKCIVKDDDIFTASHDGVVSYNVEYDMRTNCMCLNAHYDYPGTALFSLFVLYLLLFIIFILLIIGLVFIIIMIFSKGFHHPTYIRWVIFISTLLLIYMILGHEMIFDFNI